MSKGSLSLIGLMALVGLWFAFGHHIVQSTAMTPNRALVTYSAVPQQFPLHGVSWQITHVYDVVARAEKVVAQIADLGADTVMFSAARYQENATSASIYVIHERMPTADQWRAIIAAAHRHNLRVVLMPIILLDKPRGTEWRGEISPPNWDVWFESYKEYILDMARIAADNRVDVLMVGSELVSTEKYGAQWKDLIANVRLVFPGKLSYSANWDHYRKIEYWQDLDYVGMTTYHKLSDTPGPSLDALLRAWKPIREEILTWQHTIGKPILFTEVGWCSQEGASVEAWNYYHRQEPSEAGLEEQRRLYAAFMQTWDNVPEVGGVLWWEWTESEGGPKDYNYTPRNKPAEKELRHWFAEQRQRAEELAATTRKARPTSTRVTTMPADARSTDQPAMR